MASYRLLVRVVVGTALALTLGPTLVRAAGHRSKGEMFPLSRWAMFNRVDSQVDDYGIRIRAIPGGAIPGGAIAGGAIAGGAISPPVYFENAGLEHSQSVTAYYAIQKFAQRIVAGDPEAPTSRKLVEERYLAQPGVEYEIVARRWDPLVRWNGGAFESERVVASFVSGGAS